MRFIILLSIVLIAFDVTKIRRIKQALFISAPLICCYNYTSYYIGPQCLRFYSVSKNEPSNVFNNAKFPMTPIFLFDMLVTKVVAASITQNWTVQRQDEYGFSSVACDQTIEQTLNR